MGIKIFFIVISIFIFTIFIVGKLKLNEKIKRTLLLTITFIYNCLIGNASFIAFYIIVFSTLFFNSFLLSTIIIGLYFLLLLIPINIYAKRKIDISWKKYILINIIGFLIGACVLWRNFMYLK